MRRAAKCQQCLSAASLTLVNKSVAFKDKYFRQTIKALSATLKTLQD